MYPGAVLICGLLVAFGIFFCKDRQRLEGQKINREELSKQKRPDEEKKRKDVETERRRRAKEEEVQEILTALRKPSTRELYFSQHDPVPRNRNVLQAPALTNTVARTQEAAATEQYTNPGTIVPTKTITPVPQKHVASSFKPVQVADARNVDTRLEDKLQARPADLPPAFGTEAYKQIHDDFTAMFGGWRHQHAPCGWVETASGKRPASAEEVFTQRFGKPPQQYCEHRHPEVEALWDGYFRQLAYYPPFAAAYLAQDCMQCELCSYTCLSAASRQQGAGQQPQNVRHDSTTPMVDGSAHSQGGEALDPLFSVYPQNPLPDLPISQAQDLAESGCGAFMRMVNNCAVP